MSSWSPSYFSRWCALWVVYVGLRALLLSPSLEAFCDLLTWGVRSQTRALIAWAGIKTMPSGWTAISIKPCFLWVLFHAFFFFHFKVRWTIAWITERITHCLFFFVASPEFTTVSSLSLSLSHFPKIYIPCTSYSFIFFVPSPIRWSCLLLWSPQPPFFAVSGIIDKCAWLWPLLAFSSFARHFVAFNHAFNCQWSSRWMAVERETSGILSLFLWVYTMEQELSPISRSDEDLTALVDSALGILAWYEVCVCILWL